MPTYIVTAKGTVVEYYEVEADSEAEAFENFFDGKFLWSDADTFPVEAVLDEPSSQDEDDEL